MAIDLVRIDLVRIDLVTQSCLVTQCHTKSTWPPGYEAITDLPSAMVAILVLLESSSTTSALLDLLSVAHSHFRPAHDSKLLAGF